MVNKSVSVNLLLVSLVCFFTLAFVFCCHADDLEVSAADSAVVSDSDDGMSPSPSVQPSDLADVADPDNIVGTVEPSHTIDDVYYLLDWLCNFFFTVVTIGIAIFIVWVLLKQLNRFMV